MKIFDLTQQTQFFNPEEMRLVIGGIGGDAGGGGLPDPNPEPVPPPAN